jgi:sodium/potassium-transporting ATPase subunit alpha
MQVKFIHENLPKLGAPDILVKKCKYILNEDGSQSELNEESRKELDALQYEWCQQGQRVLLLCKKHDTIANVTFQSSSELETYIKETDDFCIVGMLGIIDKPREGIDEVIKTCRTAGWLFNFRLLLIKFLIIF